MNRQGRVVVGLLALATGTANYAASGAWTTGSLVGCGLMLIGAGLVGTVADD
jgi:hypothetical protein